MVSQSLLGGIFDGIVNKIIGAFDAFFQSLLASFAMLLYLVIWAIAQIIKVVEVIFKKLLGIDTDYTNVGDPTQGEPIFNDIISQLLFSGPVVNIFISLLVLSIVLLFIFTFIAIIRSEFTMDVKNSAKGPIIGRAFKSLAMFVIVPAVAYLGLIGTSVLGQAVWRMFNTNDSGLAEQVLYLTAHKANKVRTNSEFARYINGEHGASWASDNAYINNNGGDFKVNSNDIGVIQKELAEQIDAAFKGNVDSNGTKWKFLGMWGSAKSPGLERDIQFMEITGATYTYWDIGVVGYYYKFIDMNYIMGFLSGIFMLYLLFKLCSQLVKRIFEIVILMLLAAPMHSIAPLDNGNAAKQWQQNFIRRVILILGPIFALNMYFVMMAALEDVDFANTISIQHSIDQSPVAMSAGGAVVTLDYDGSTMMQNDNVSNILSGAEINVSASVNYHADSVAAATMGSNMLLAVDVDEKNTGISASMFNMFFYFLFAICGLQVVESAGALLGSILGMDDVMKDAAGGINKTMQGFTDPDKMSKVGMKLGAGTAVSVMAKKKKGEVADYGMTRDQMLEDDIQEEEGMGASHYAKSTVDALDAKKAEAGESFTEDEKEEARKKAIEQYGEMSDDDKRKYTMDKILNTEGGDKMIKERVDKDNAKKNIFERGKDRRAWFQAGNSADAEKDDPASYLGKKGRAWDALHDNGLNVADMWKGKGVLSEVMGEMSPLAKEGMGLGAKMDGLSKTYKFDEPKEWKDAGESSARMWYAQNMKKENKDAYRRGGVDPAMQQSQGGGGGAAPETSTPDANTGRRRGANKKADINAENVTVETQQTNTGGAATGTGGAAASSVNKETAGRAAYQQKLKDALNTPEGERTAEQAKLVERNRTPEQRAAAEASAASAMGSMMQYGSRGGPTIRQGEKAQRIITKMDREVVKGQQGDVNLKNWQQMLNELTNRLRGLNDRQTQELKKLTDKINNIGGNKKTGYYRKDTGEKISHQYLMQLVQEQQETRNMLAAAFASGGASMEDRGGATGSGTVHVGDGKYNG